MMEQLKQPTLRLTAEEAEVVVAKFESDDVLDLDPDEVQLLERFFLEHPEEKGLSLRYEVALRRRTELDQ